MPKGICWDALVPENGAQKVLLPRVTNLEVFGCGIGLSQRLEQSISLGTEYPPIVLGRLAQRASTGVLGPIACRCGSDARSKKESQGEEGPGKKPSDTEFGLILASCIDALLLSLTGLIDGLSSLLKGNCQLQPMI